MRDVICLALISLLLLSIFLPRIINATWAFTDDGQYMYILSHSLKVFEKEGVGSGIKVLAKHSEGRFIPVADLTNALRMSLCGLNPHYHYLFQFLLAVICVLCLYATVRILTGSIYASFIGTLTYIIFSANWENYYRLYTPEPLVTTALSVFSLMVVFFLHEDIKPGREDAAMIVALATVAYAVFAKETTLSFIIPMGYALIWARIVPQGVGGAPGRSKKFRGFMSVGFLVIVISWFSLRARAGIETFKLSGYATNYNLSFDRIAVSAGKYYVLFWNNGGPFFFIILFLAITVFYFRGRKSVPTEKRFWVTFYILWGLSFILILLPWKFSIGRYLMPAIWAFSVVIGLCWHAIFSPDNGISRRTITSVKILLTCCFILYVGINAVRINHMRVWTDVRDRSNTALLDALANYSGAGGAKLWFAYPEPVETYSHINPILRYTRGVQYYSVDRLDIERPHYTKDDLVVIPGSEGDGHFSCDGPVDGDYIKVVMAKVAPDCILLKNIEYRKHSLTVYPDSPVYNYIKRAGWNLPPSVIGSRLERPLWEDQELAKTWSIYRVVR